MTEIKKYAIFEVSFTASYEGNPFKDVSLTAVFRRNADTDTPSVTVHGFYDGNNTWRIRFMPQEEGEWTYVTDSSLAVLNGHTCIFLF